METKLWIKGRDGWYVAAWGDDKKINWYGAYYKGRGYETHVGFGMPRG